MTFVFLGLLGIIVLFAIIYLAAISKFHNNKMPQLSKEVFSVANAEISKVLFIFPHPDDETFAAGGLINKLSKDKRFEVHVVAATYGEKGTELVDKPPQELAPIRKQEFEKAVTSLGADVHGVWDFPDGNLEAHEQNLRQKLVEYINKEQITTVITFERTGLYSHPDHIKLAEIVHEITEGEINLQAFYVSLPENIRKRLELPKQITLDGQDIPLDSLTPDEPEAKIAVFSSMLARLRAARAYKSQNVPRGLQLLGFVSVFAAYEYYSTVWDKEANAT